MERWDEWTAEIVRKRIFVEKEVDGKKTLRPIFLQSLHLIAEVPQVLTQHYRIVRTRRDGDTQYSVYGLLKPLKSKWQQLELTVEVPEDRYTKLEGRLNERTVLEFLTRIVGERRATCLHSQLEE